MMLVLIVLIVLIVLTNHKVRPSLPLHSLAIRVAAPGEPHCVICGLYAPYIEDKTNLDICSKKCKEILLKQLENKHQQLIEDIKNEQDQLNVKVITVC